MLIVAFAIALLGQTAGPAPSKGDAHFAHVVQGRLTPCGIRASDIHVQWMQEWQGYSVEIVGDDASFPQARLACIDRTDDSRHGLIRFKSVATEKRFYDIKSHSPRVRAAMRKGVREARRWLAARGKLRGLPRPDPKAKDPTDFLRRIEAFCGVPQASALQAPKDGVIVGHLSDKFDKADCLINALTVSSPEGDNYRVGLIVEDAPAP